LAAPSEVAPSKKSTAPVGDRGTPLVDTTATRVSGLAAGSGDPVAENTEVAVGSSTGWSAGLQIVAVPARRTGEHVAAPGPHGAAMTVSTTMARLSLAGHSDVEHLARGDGKRRGLDRSETPGRATGGS
jgi:hypothetical protein